MKRRSEKEREGIVEEKERLQNQVGRLDRRLQEVSQNYKQFDERFLGERQKQDDMNSRLVLQHQ